MTTNRWFIYGILCIDREKDEDEGVPSETEEDRRQQENRAKEIRGDPVPHSHS